MILYPTETVYALGVDALDRDALAQLRALKGRDATKTASWLVGSIAEIERYAMLEGVAARIAERFLPGPLTLVLPVRSSIPSACTAPDGTVGFRVSSDSVASALSRQCAHPLTCTSANLSGMPTLATVPEILAQFGECASVISRVIDDGPRSGTPSTVVRVLDDEVEIIREGAVSSQEIRAILV